MASLFSNFVNGCLFILINLPGFSFHKAMKPREAIAVKIKNVIATRKTTLIHRKTMVYWEDYWKRRVYLKKQYQTSSSIFYSLELNYCKDYAFCCVLPQSMSRSPTTINSM